MITPAQHKQSENIINLPSMEEEAAATSIALGARKSPDVHLPHDPFDAQLQEKAEEVDEHRLLYPVRLRSGGEIRHRQKMPSSGFFR